jgi:hypothetical protein
MIPGKTQQRLDWLNDHLPLWAANAAEIGLSDDAVSQIQGLYSTANTNWNSAKAARNTARNATITSRTSYSAMNNLMGALIKTIRSHAQATGDKDVYALAGIQPPAPPTPKPAPGIPTDVTTTVDNMGRIVLRWKSKNGAPSTGAAFQIRRKLDGQSTFRLVATVQGRSFTDEAIPSGTISATYIIKGIRGNSAGEPSEPTTVYLHSVDTTSDGELMLAA